MYKQISKTYQHETPLCSAHTEKDQPEIVRRRNANPETWYSLGGAAMGNPFKFADDVYYVVASTDHPEVSFVIPFSCGSAADALDGAKRLLEAGALVDGFNNARITGLQASEQNRSVVRHDGTLMKPQTPYTLYQGHADHDQSPNPS